MINKAKTLRSLGDIIPELDSLPENEELFIEKQNDKDKIPQELAKKYFETINSSVLPF